MERSCLVSEVKASLVKGFPDACKKRGPGVGFLIAIQVFIARTGQTGWCVLSRRIVWPDLNGSVRNFYSDRHVVRILPGGEESDIICGQVSLKAKKTKNGERHN